MSMKMFWTIVMGSALALFSQTAVNLNPDNYAVGSTFTNRTIDSLFFDPGPSGAGSWNLSGFTGGRTDSLTAVAYSASIPHIGECFLTPNYIPYFRNETDTSVTEGWAFYRVESPTIIPLGLWGTFDVETGNDASLSAIDVAHTPAFTFPVHYLDNWVEASNGGGRITYGALVTINYSYNDTTWHRVDGYGLVTTPIGTFQTLRLKNFNKRHSWSSHIIWGFDKTERKYSYSWICTEAGILATFTGPIDSTGGIPDSNFTLGTLAFQVNNSSMGMEEHSERPSALSLSARPNPFNSAVTIEAPLASRLEIFDISGRPVRDLSGLLSAERNSAVLWDGKSDSGANLPSGIYFARARCEDKELVTKVALIR